MLAGNKLVRSTLNMVYSFSFIVLLFFRFVNKCFLQLTVLTGDPNEYSLLGIHNDAFEAAFMFEPWPRHKSHLFLGCYSALADEFSYKKFRDDVFHTLTAKKNEIISFERCWRQCTFHRQERELRNVVNFMGLQNFGQICMCFNNLYGYHERAPLTSCENDCTGTHGEFCRENTMLVYLICYPGFHSPPYCDARCPNNICMGGEFPGSQFENFHIRACYASTGECLTGCLKALGTKCQATTRTCRIINTGREVLQASGKTEVFSYSDIQLESKWKGSSLTYVLLKDRKTSKVVHDAHSGLLFTKLTAPHQNYGYVYLITLEYVSTFDLDHEMYKVKFSHKIDDIGYARTDVVNFNQIIENHNKEVLESWGEDAFIAFANAHNQPADKPYLFATKAEKDGYSEYLQYAAYSELDHTVGSVVQFQSCKPGTKCHSDLLPTGYTNFKVYAFIQEAFTCSKRCLQQRCTCDGKCLLGCTPGFMAPFCTFKCPIGSFGLYCRYQCSPGCKDKICDSITGECLVGCKDGAVGSYCTERCPDSYWGKTCEKRCSVHCLNEYKCSTRDGSCIGGCKAGYHGSTCEEPCLKDAYGPNCTKRCGNCKPSETCHHITGECPNGCQGDEVAPSCLCREGFWGPPLCNNPCGNCREGFNCEGETGQCVRNITEEITVAEEALKVVLSDKQYENAFGKPKSIDVSTDVSDDVHQSKMTYSADQSNEENPLDPADPKSLENESLRKRIKRQADVYGRRDFSSSRFEAQPNDEENGDESFEDIYGAPPVPGEAETIVREEVADIENEELDEAVNSLIDVVKDRADNQLLTAGDFIDPNESMCEDETLQSPQCVCQKGRFGEGCMHQCQNCATVQCALEDGDCMGECEIGFRKPFCKDTCLAGYHGVGCQETCGECKGVSPCEPLTGECPSGCKDGFEEKKCKRCLPGLYGEECTGKCGKCLGISQCDAVTGYCEKGCEVGLEWPMCQCPIGYYGFPDCDKYCGNCVNSTGCLPDSGACAFGCKPGFMGLFCDTACETGSYGENCAYKCGSCYNHTDCHPVDGSCSEGCEGGLLSPKCLCPKNTFSDQCIECGHCANASSCDPDSGVCRLGCIPGFRAPDCKCALHTWGEKCELCGHCRSDAECDLLTGACPSGCTVGFRGKKCVDTCEFYSWGENCTQECGFCKNCDVCNPANGECPFGCEDGYYPPSCKQSCKTGMYGPMCLNPCGKCLRTDTCRIKDGKCQYGCQKGFIPPMCEDECIDGFYGANCLSPCGRCENNTACNKVSGRCPAGCMEGFVPPMCQTLFSEIEDMDDYLLLNGEDRDDEENMNNQTLGEEPNLAEVQQISTNQEPAAPEIPAAASFTYAQGEQMKLCTRNQYGPNCEYKCGLCLNELCNMDTGLCILGCWPGYIPMRCTEKCPPRFYGMNCAYACRNCLHDDNCRHTDGLCPRGCKPGWSGRDCNVEVLDNGDRLIVRKANYLTGEAGGFKKSYYCLLFSLTFLWYF